jgi:hypothetical protein
VTTLRAEPRVRWTLNPGFTPAAVATTSALAGVVIAHRLGDASFARTTKLGLGLVVLLVLATLAFRRTYLLFGISFALLAYVPVDPAPIDVVIALLVLASLSVGSVPFRVPMFVALPLIGFGVISVQSMGNAVSLGRAAKFELITLYVLVLLVWLSGMFSRGDWLRLAVRTYVAAAALSAVAASLALFIHFPGSAHLIYDGARAKGFFKDPNVFGPFLVPAAAIVLEDINTRNLFPWSRKVLVLIFMTLSVGTVLAYSRAGWLNYAIALTTVIGFQAARRRGWQGATKSLAVLALGGAIGLGVLASTGSLSFFLSRSHLQAYDQTRFATQTKAFDQATAHVLGHGPGQTELSLDYAAHSLYARAAYEQGVIGLALVLVILGGILYCGLALARHNRSVHGIGSAALVGSWLGLIANSAFVDTLHWRHLPVIAAIICSGYYTMRQDRLTHDRWSGNTPSTGLRPLLAPALRHSAIRR